MEARNAAAKSELIKVKKDISKSRNMDFVYKGEDIETSLQKDNKRGSTLDNEDSGILKIPYYHKKPKILKKTVRPKVFEGEEGNEDQGKNESNRMKAIRNELRSVKTVYVKNRATSPDPEIFDINEIYALNVLVKRKTEEVYVLEEAIRERDILFNERESNFKLLELDLANAKLDLEKTLTRMAEAKLSEANFQYEENSIKKKFVELQKEIGKLEMLVEKKDEELFIYKHKTERMSEQGKNVEEIFEENAKEMEKKNKESFNLLQL